MNYFKKHLGDYAKKTGHLSPLEHGVYGLIMDAYYDREQGPTLIEATRYARARTEEEKSAVLAVLDEFFTLGPDDRYIQNRIEDELTTYRAQAEVNRGIAVAREQRKRERRVNDPSTVRAQVVHDEDQDREPSHKPIANSHKPVIKDKVADAPDGSALEDGAAGEKPAKPAAAAMPALPDWMPLDAWAGYLEMRKKQKKPPTVRAVELLIGVLGKMLEAGHDVALILDTSTKNCWTDVYVPRADDRRTAQRGAAQGPSAFHGIANADHTSSVAAMEASKKRMGVPDYDPNDNLDFDRR